MLLNLVIGRLESQRPKAPRRRFHGLGQGLQVRDLLGAFCLRLQLAQPTNLELFHAAPQAADPREGFKDATRAQ
jgi:hypothetical protein